MKNTRFGSMLLCLLLLFLPGCSPRNEASRDNNMKVTPQATPSPGHVRAEDLSGTAEPLTTGSTTSLPMGSYMTPSDQQLRASLITWYGGLTPQQWGETTTGVLRSMATHDKMIALTFDACGGKGGNGYDADLINYLSSHHIPVTLFINSRWIDANYYTFMALVHNDNFLIENHGYEHRPLSVNGKSAWGINGTQNVGEVVDEVLDNARKLEKLTGKWPRYFRSGTAYYDEVAVKVTRDLGINCVNYNVLGDAGATFNTEQVKNALLSSTPGSIVIGHMNHPEKDTAEGVMAAVPLLIQRGYRFAKLSEFPLQ